MKHKTHQVDFCIVGGGMTGLCAAIAAARHGAQVALIKDAAADVFALDATGTLSIVGIERAWNDRADSANSCSVINEARRNRCARTHRDTRACRTGRFKSDSSIWRVRLTKSTSQETTPTWRACLRVCGSST